MSVKSWRSDRESLREKCQNAEFFLVCVFLYLNWIRKFTPYHRIQSLYRIIWTRKNSVLGHFSCSESFYYLYGKVLFQRLLFLRTAAFWKQLVFLGNLLFKSLLSCKLWTCLPCQRISLHTLFIFRCSAGQLSVIAKTKEDVCWNSSCWQSVTWLQLINRRIRS